MKPKAIVDKLLETEPVNPSPDAGFDTEVGHDPNIGRWFFYPATQGFIHVKSYREEDSRYLVDLYSRNMAVGPIPTALRFDRSWVRTEKPIKGRVNKVTESGPNKTDVTLEYRPYKKGDDWKWYWVLIPDHREKALASGEADNRTQASIQARNRARKLNAVITKVDTAKSHHK